MTAPARNLRVVQSEPIDPEVERQARIAKWLGVGIPARLEASHGRSGIKLIVNHAHVARVLAVKQRAEDSA